MTVVAGGLELPARPVRAGLADHDDTFAAGGRPTGNAVVERFIRTLKEELIWLRGWDSADELRLAIVAWLRHYNEKRPHQALDWQTPSERRAARLVAPVVLAATPARTAA